MTQTEIDNLILRANALIKSNWLHAVHILEQASESNPSNPQILQNLAEIFLEKQLYEKALSFFQAAIELKPGDIQLLYMIGNCYFAMGDYRIANTYFNLIPDPPPEVLYNKALCFAFMGMHQESIQVIHSILKVLSDNPFIHFLLIEQYLRIQNYSDAYDTISKAEKRFGKHKQLLLLSAVVHSKRGVWLKAFHSFQQYESLSPISNPDYLLSYALAANKIGMNKRAIELLMKARDINPYNSSIHEELIRLQLYQGDAINAKRSLGIAKKYLVHFNPIMKLLQERIRNADF